MSLPEIGVPDILVISTTMNGNKITKKVAQVGNYFEIIYKNNVAGTNHGGVKKTYGY